MAITADALKRDISQDERDNIPDEDFAGRDHSFFIQKPEDVNAAANRIGTAGPDNYSTDQLKANIIRIARRKGPSFVAELPQEWKDGAEKAMAALKAAGMVTCDKCNGDGCEKCQGLGVMKADGAEPDADDKAATPELEGPADATPEDGPPAGPVGHGLHQGMHDHLHEHDGMDGAHSHPHNHEADNEHEHVHTAPDEKAAEKRAPYTIQRLHDLTCPVYSLDAVKTAYPALVKDGVAAALGPMARSALYQMLVEELTEDAGTGSESDGIKQLATAYCDLAKFLTGEMVEMAMGDEPALMMAHAEQHGAFKAVNSDFITGGSELPMPNPTDPPKPSEFRMPYIQTGHYRETASGPPSIPGAAHTVEADQFDRGLITAGHERNSPGNKAVAADVLAGIHAAITKSWEGCCPVIVKVIDGSQPIKPPTESLPTLDSSRPHPVSGDVPESDDFPSLKTRLPAVTKGTANLEVEMADLRALVAQQGAALKRMASEPDPNQAPIRGIMGVTPGPNGAVAQKVTQSDVVKRAEESEAAQRRSEEIAFYTRALNSGDHDRQMVAERKLAELGIG